MRASFQKYEFAEPVDGLFTQFDAKIVVSNYRCFIDKPLEIRLKPGIVAFVGPNNAGKSTILRLFWELRPMLKELLNQQKMVQILSGNTNLYVNWDGSGVDRSALFPLGNSKELSISLSLHEDASAVHSIPLILSCSIVLYRDIDQGISVNFKLAEDEPPIRSMHGGLLQVDSTTGIVKARNEIGSEVMEYSIEYLAALFRCICESSYFGPFRHVIGGLDEDLHFDSSVGGSFVSDWDKLKNGSSNENTLRATSVEKAIAQLLGVKSVQINVNSEPKELRVIIDGKPNRLDEVGSGVAQLIQVLALSAIYEPPFILIDEPELNLHPRLQIDFVRKLRSYSRHGVYFATHSYGLARSTADEVYLVSKQGSDGAPICKPITREPRLSEALGELNYSGLADLGTACVLLVEGSGEILTFKHLLSLYELSDGFIILSLGGSGLINPERREELVEMKHICSRVAVIIDRDGADGSPEPDPKRTAFIDVCNELGFKSHMFDRRAIENYFPQKAIKSAFPRHKYSQLGQFEKLGSAWSKRDNLKIAEQMGKADLEETDLGSFLSELAGWVRTESES